MKSFCVALLIAAIAVCSYGKPTAVKKNDPKACDIGWATYCLKTYIDRWGFNSTQTGVFPDPSDFNAAFEKYIDATGVNGLANGHTWWLALQTCLGPNSLPCLFDNDILQQIFNTHSTAMDGTLWLIQFLEEDFINSIPAYNVLRQNYHCATQVKQHYAAALTQCQTTYSNDIIKDPANICQYQVFYMTCIQTIYGSNCGNQMGGFTCNEVGIYLRVLNPECIDNPSSSNFCYSMT